MTTDAFVVNEKEQSSIGSVAGDAVETKHLNTLHSSQFYIDERKWSIT